MKNAVIYARYSSDKQTEQSIDGQIRVCTEFAEQQGYNIINSYIDRATTGTNDRRPAFQQMLADSAKHNFEIVLVYKLDRFSRNRYDSAKNKYFLKKQNVKVVSACERITDDPEGIILEGMIESFNEYYSAELSQKVKRGIKENICKGLFFGGFTLLGYKVVNKKVLIDEESSPIIKFVFENFANGMDRKEIVEQVNKQFKLKKTFNYNTLAMTIRNKKYMGEFYYQGELYENMYPAIVSKALFNKAQQRLKTRDKAPYKKDNTYILTGKAYCRLCGSSIVGASAHGRNNVKHSYYVCQEQYKKHNCIKKYENKEELENIVIDRTIEHILTPSVIETIAHNSYNAYKKSKENLNHNLLKKEINKIEQQIEKTVSLFEEAEVKILRDKLQAKIQDLELQKEDLEKELKKITLINSLDLTKNKIKDWVVSFANLDYSKIENRIKLIKMFVNIILIDNENIIIIYNNNPNNEPLTPDSEELKIFINEYGSHLVHNAPPTTFLSECCFFIEKM